jgi:membrane associated rhomboid family serine protease
MVIIVPYHVDVPMRCRPWTNWVLIGLTIVFYPLCVSSTGLSQLGEQLMLGGTSWVGFVSHVLVHADLEHLLGNMLFLWLFGNAVCAKVGNLVYPFLYFGLGLAAGLASFLIDPGPAVGASGAINGIVGMFVVWYLLNEISCLYGYLHLTAGDAGTFSVSSYWMVLLWLAFDIWGAITGGDNIAYFAHLAGFAIGFLLAILMLVLRWVQMEPGERSLLQILSGDEELPGPAKDRRTRGFTRLGGCSPLSSEPSSEQSAAADGPLPSPREPFRPYGGGHR